MKESLIQTKRTTQKKNWADNYFRPWNESIERSKRRKKNGKSNQFRMRGIKGTNQYIELVSLNLESIDELRRLFFIVSLDFFRSCFCLFDSIPRANKVQLIYFNELQITFNKIFLSDRLHRNIFIHSAEATGLNRTIATQSICWLFVQCTAHTDRVR